MKLPRLSRHPPRILDIYGLNVTGTTIQTENALRYEAQSYLYGLVDDPLPDTAAEAADIIAWRGRQYASEQYAPDTWFTNGRE